VWGRMSGLHKQGTGWGKSGSAERPIKVLWRTRRTNEREMAGNQENPPEGGMRGWGGGRGRRAHAQISSKGELRRVGEKDKHTGRGADRKTLFT